MQIPKKNSQTTAFPAEKHPFFSPLRVPKNNLLDSFYPNIK